jgi:predicted HTH transcriptional regulator
VLSTEELEGVLRVGYEARGFEFKTHGKSDDRYFLAKIARAALSMGNLRDGGYVVIGIDDARPDEMLPGLDGDELASWLAYDDVSARLAVYCDPPLTFQVARLELVTGALVVLLQVHEFSDVPHLCAREYPEVLRKGALYVRPRRMPETAEVASSVEMREVLDLAAEKRLRAYVMAAERAGIHLAATGPGGAEEARVRAAAEFEAQRRRGWA